MAKGINRIVAEALAWHMQHAQGGPISNRALAERCKLSEGTIRNILRPEDRAPSAKGKEPSVKITELAMIAAALGVEVVDLVQDMDPDAREKRRRAGLALQVLLGNSQPGDSSGELIPATGTLGR